MQVKGSALEIGLVSIRQNHEKGRKMTQNPINFGIGDDLYGVSISELDLRINVLEDEISRIKAELAKKQAERSAADTLFAQKK